MVLDTACDPMNNLALFAVGTNDAVTVINANDSRIIKVKSENTEFAEDHCEDARFDVESDYCDCLAFSPKIEGNKLYLAYADDVKLYIKTIYMTQDENKHVEYYLKADENEDVESDSDKEEDVSYKINDQRVTAVKFYNKGESVYLIYSTLNRIFLGLN